MIDWLQLLAHSSWILGAAVLLAQGSRMLYNAELAGNPLRSIWSRFADEPGSWFGLLLIGAGLAGTGRSIWEVIFWALFALLCAVFGLQQWRRRLLAVRSNNAHGN